LSTSFKNSATGEFSELFVVRAIVYDRIDSLGHEKTMFARLRNSLSFTVLAVMICVFFADIAFAYTLKSDEGKFTAELPAEPTFEKLNETSAIGPYVRYQWLTDQGAKAWIVTYNDYTAGTIAKTGLEEAYKGAVQGSVRGTKGELRSDKAITQAGISGHEILVSIPGPFMMRQRIFIVGDRLYQNIYVGPPGTEDDAGVDAFFASFVVAK
jgi:hypothetical protein